MSFASTWELPWERTFLHSWASRLSASSETSLPWQARRTPRTTLSRLKGSVTPLRFITRRTAFSIVVKRPPHLVHSRRRRMAAPASMMRESMTREWSWWQNGQYTACFQRLSWSGPMKKQVAPILLLKVD